MTSTQFEGAAIIVELSQVGPAGPPGTVGGPGKVRLITSPTSDTMLATDNYIFWNNPAPTAKIQNIIAGSVDALGNTTQITVADGFGNCAEYPIILMAQGCTINKKDSYAMNQRDFQTTALKWDGISNYQIINNSYA